MEDEEDESDVIYQQYLKNLKDSGFKRTTPSEQPEAVNPKRFKCNKCTFETTENKRLGEHIKNAHNKTGNVSKEKTSSSVQYCHFYNNVGSCHFESKNGRPCKFKHEVAPRCNFDGNCTRTFCMYSHQNQNMAFLANAPRNFGPPIGQRSSWGVPPPWMNQRNQRRGNPNQNKF